MNEQNSTDFDAVIAKLQGEITQVTTQIGFMAADHGGSEAYLDALGVDMNLPYREKMEQLQKTMSGFSGFADGSTTRMYLLISRIAKLAGPSCFELLLRFFTLLGMLEEVKEQQAQAKADNFEEYFKATMAQLPVPPAELRPLMPIEETVFGESPSSLPYPIQVTLEGRLLCLCPNCREEFTKEGLKDDE